MQKKMACCECCQLSGLHGGLVACGRMVLSKFREKRRQQNIRGLVCPSYFPRTSFNLFGTWTEPVITFWQKIIDGNIYIGNL